MPKGLKLLGDWHEMLVWCPSQCWRDVEDESGTKYNLYLRWRWDDPWQGHLIRVTEEQGAAADDETEFPRFSPIEEWSPELFAKYNVQYSDEEIDKAKEKIVELAEQWLREKAR